MRGVRNLCVTMRLFIAVKFDDIEKEIIEIRESLRSQSRKGNFTRDENLHLTLAFLGEVPGSRISEIENVMEEIDEEPFEVEFNVLGCFKRRDGGDVWWIGCRKNRTLMDVQRKLAEGLRESGFKIEKRAFKPHLTLGREVILKSDDVFSEKQISMTSSVASITLMLSDRVRGKLVYTPLYEKYLWYK